MIPTRLTRRQALASVGSLMGGSALARAQESRAIATDPKRPVAPMRLAPREELVNVPEFEEMAKLTLPADVFSTIASGDRADFDRITLRPRALVPTLDLDLSVQVFGESSWAPMLVGPVPEQKRFHAEGELGTVKGAAAAKAIMVVSSRSSVPIDQIAAQAGTPLWYYTSVDEAKTRARIEQAVNAGCKAVCLAFGSAARGKSAAPPPRIDWAAAERMRQGLRVPVLAAGITTADQATQALQHGFEGIVVARTSGSPEAPIELLPGVADAVAGKVPIFLEGTVQRGADIFKALSLGAQAVLIDQPSMWGLAAYGPQGIETVFALLLNELARTMGSCGKVNVKALDRAAVKVHAPRRA